MALEYVSHDNESGTRHRPEPARAPVRASLCWYCLSRTRNRSLGWCRPAWLVRVVFCATSRTVNVGDTGDDSSNDDPDDSEPDVPVCQYSNTHAHAGGSDNGAVHRCDVSFTNRSDSHSYQNGDGNCNSDSHSYQNGDVDRYLDTATITNIDSNTDADRNTDTITNVDTTDSTDRSAAESNYDASDKQVDDIYTDAVLYTNVVSNSISNIDRSTDTITNIDPDRNTDPDSHSHVPEHNHSPADYDNSGSVD